MIKITFMGAGSTVFRKKCTWRLYVHTGTSRERDRTL